MSLVDELLAVNIYPYQYRGSSRETYLKLTESYRLIEEARKAFQNMEITLMEYFDLLDQHDINVDIYSKQLEQNMERLKLI